jgi:hypothetical protein
MGTWGVGILDDDVTTEIYGSYIDQFNEGQNCALIRTELEKSYSDALDDEDEADLFWLSLAQAQWECGVLDADVLEHVVEIIQSGHNLELWEENENYERRKQTLEKFLRTIQEPRIKPRKRKRRRFIPAPFEPGDCLAVHLTGNQYGAALVLNKMEDQYEGTNLVGLLNYCSEEKPPLSFFSERKWLYPSAPVCYWCPSYLYKQYGKALEKVGHVPIHEDDPKTSSAGAGWNLELYLQQHLAKMPP